MEYPLYKEIDGHHVHFYETLVPKSKRVGKVLHISLIPTKLAGLDNLRYVDCSGVDCETCILDKYAYCTIDPTAVQTTVKEYFPEVREDHPEWFI